MTLSYKYIKTTEDKVKYVGRGRGCAGREKVVEEKVRCQITNVTRNSENIDEAVMNFGWKVYVTDLPADRLSFVDVVRSYRHQYRIERIFNHLKSHLNIAPMYVKTPEQIKGLTHLLVLGARAYILIEYIVRRSLKQSGEKLAGLHMENYKKETDSPTTGRLLKAFSNITLTVIEMNGCIVRHLTPLSQLQLKILKHLGFGHKIYTSLEEIQEFQI